jgi:hypothetical protein
MWGLQCAQDILSGAGAGIDDASGAEFLECGDVEVESLAL